MNEAEVREHVRKLRKFYTDFLVYVLVNVFLIFIWLLSGAGYFWPIWVIIGWGIGLGIHAFTIGLIPQMTSMVPFLTAEWEDEEVRKLVSTRKIKKKSSEPAKAAAKKTIKSKKKK